ncbi:MAG: putative integrase [Sulfolobales archaeon]|nr:putative integrase [Sulfolobales archaeon]MCG2884221.1 putative integrase [Sulfolobales archaeon]MCG2907872.1 putative integrase [Sulfolobales archaeon]
MNGDVRKRYVGPLIDVAETYLKLKSETGVLGVTP